MEALFTMLMMMMMDEGSGMFSVAPFEGVFAVAGPLGVATGVDVYL